VPWRRDKAQRGAQVRDTLGALAERFAALRPGGAPGLALSRLGARQARPLLLKRVVQYSPAWVKSQNRMASTSNQARVARSARAHLSCVCLAVDAACVAPAAAAAHAYGALVARLPGHVLGATLQFIRHLCRWVPLGRLWLALYVSHP